MQKDFLGLYRAVFNADGALKSVGRNECIELIKAATEVGSPSVDYGNLETGIINLENVKYLRRNILRFMYLYPEVFEEDGSVKACGREKCKSLIYYAYSIRPHGHFGNPDTGWMDQENITALFEELKNVEE
jgi:hypothetical protein